MSNYQDIYRDLPSRVNEVWQRTKDLQEKEAKDLSVTAMLMAAAAGLAMPLEDIHIAGNRSERPNHVLLDTKDHATYQIALDQFSDFFAQKISECEVLSEAIFSRCTALNEVRDVGEYGGGNAVDLEKAKVSFAFSILRNALAHNNIVAFGSEIEKIEKLTFFSECWTESGRKRKIVGWNLLTISTKSFEKFLNFWFHLVSASGAYAAAIEAMSAQEDDSES